MGKIKYLADIRKLFKESPVVDLDSLKKFLNKKDKRYVWLIVNNLLKKGEIKKLAKGYYTIHEDNSLAVFCFKPSYLGLQNALTFHHLWDQATIPVIITPRKIRQGLRVIMGSNALIRRIDKKYLFGFDYYLDGDFYLPYSDIEKTFIDMVYFRQPLDKETLKNFRKKIDRKKLSSYLKFYPIKFRKKVLKVLG